LVSIVRALRAKGVVSFSAIARELNGQKIRNTASTKVQLASCAPAKVKIDAAYVEANTPIVREQLQKAGVRLAHMLDAALGK
jgi:S1/P1 Nuclease